MRLAAEQTLGTAGRRGRPGERGWAGARLVLAERATRWAGGTVSPSREP